MSANDEKMINTNPDTDKSTEETAVSDNGENAKNEEEKDVHSENDKEVSEKKIFAKIKDDNENDEIYVKNNKSHNNRLYEKYKKSKNRFVISCLAFAVLLSLLFTPIFGIKDIDVKGVSKLSRDMILEKGNLYVGENILKADIKGAQQKIASIPFVRSVSIKRVFPSKLTVNVVECREAAYITYIGNYVGLSGDGKTLEVVTGPEAKVPVITGVKLEKVKVGERIHAADSDVQKVLLQYLSSLENCNIMSEIKSIDFKDINDVKLTLSNDILVKMGESDKVSYKLAYLEKVFEQLAGQKGGTLDISNPSSSVVYKAS